MVRGLQRSHDLRSECGGQRTTRRSWFCPSVTRVLRIDVRLAGVASAFAPISTLIVNKLSDWKEKSQSQ